MEIPAITDPRGRYWSQPDRSAIQIIGDEAIVDKTTFDSLQDYSHSIPTGVYEGKMWKHRYKDQWWVRWYWQDMDGQMWTAHKRLLVMRLVDISTAGLVKWRDETIAMIPTWLGAIKIQHYKFPFSWSYDKRNLPTHRP